MFFIGIITNQKNENYIKKELANLLSEDNIIFINDKNINYLTNIQFDTLLVDSNLKEKEKELRRVISNSKNIILNSDIEYNKKLIDNLNLMVITYGFNNKATFTVSSIDNNKAIICLQRIIFSKNNDQIEPSEYEVRIDENIDKYAIIGTKIINVIYK